MTTTVLVGTTGNKEVLLKTPNGDLIVKPGAWLTVTIHGEQQLSIQETGEFVNSQPGWRPLLSKTEAT